MPTRERKWYMDRLKEQMKYEKEEMQKTRKTSTGQFSGKPVGKIPRPPPTQE